jgi:hypothetical protein
MKRGLMAFAAAGMLALSMVGAVSAESNAQGCPGDGNSAQANAGQRNELVAEAKEVARENGGNFGQIQSGYNHTSCDNGKDK